MQDKIAIHCYISGLVQGVWYRATTQEVAKRLELTGWVRNLPDGRVEVFACGKKDKVKELHKWLHQGPPRAQVSEVTYEEKPFEVHAEFSVL